MRVTGSHIAPVLQSEFIKGLDSVKVLDKDKIECQKKGLIVSIEIPPKEKLADFCKRWQITQLAIFGSAIRSDFDPNGSDIDLLVRFSPGSRWSLFDLAEMEAELTKMFGRSVDLVSWRGIERSKNDIRRNEILSSARIIYDQVS
jgi:hypothetical protein